MDRYQLSTFTIFNLDSESQLGIGNFRNSFSLYFERLITSIATREQVVNPDASVGTWTNCRMICLGGGSEDFPVDLLGPEEINYLTFKGLTSSRLYKLFKRRFTGSGPFRSHPSLREDIPLVLVNLTKQEYVSVETISVCPII
jgi:hypothetical protein